MAAGDYVAADGAYNRTIEYLNKKEKKEILILKH